MDSHCQMYHEKQIRVFSGFNDIRLKGFALNVKNKYRLIHCCLLRGETEKTGVLFLFAVCSIESNVST